MENITRTQIEGFLEQKGYKINAKMFSDLENGIYDCFYKKGEGAIKLIKEKKLFQESDLLRIFYNKIMIEEFLHFIR